jgi:uroporphyrinogen-III synthase
MYTSAYKSRVLLTRSVDENQKLLEQLESYDFDCISCPLITYKNLLVDYITIFDRYSNIIITSKYAAKLIYSALNISDNHYNNRSLSKLAYISKFEGERMHTTGMHSGFVSDLRSIALTTEVEFRKRSIELWVVGHTSAAILKSIPFIKIQYIANDVRDLINNLPKTIYNKAIYLSANEITNLLPSAITRQIIYEVTYKRTLAAQDFIEITAGIDYILLYSQNCAKTLIKLLTKYNLINTLKNTIVITISAKVANIVNIYFSNVVYVEQAEHLQMIDLLIKLCQKKVIN